MRPNYIPTDDEQIQSEQENPVDNASPETDEAQSPEELAAEKRQARRDALGGLAGGILIGGLAAGGLGMVVEEVELADEAATADANHTDTLSHPEWTDGQVPVATTVSDDMSFGEAFAAARHEVGAGGVFEWHGNLYGTYTAEEWSALSPQEQIEYNNHFNWNHIDTTTGSDVAQSDDIEVVSVDHPASEPALAQGDIEPVVATTDDDIQILGVIHDNATDANVAMATIDGQDVIFVDVDGDCTFDQMAADLNHNGVVDAGEVADISGQGLTVDHLGGITATNDDLFGVNQMADNNTDLSTDPTLNV